MIISLSISEREIVYSHKLNCKNQFRISSIIHGKVQVGRNCNQLPSIIQKRFFFFLTIKSKKQGLNLDSKIGIIRENLKSKMLKKVCFAIYIVMIIIYYFFKTIIFIEFGFLCRPSFLLNKYGKPRQVDWFSK